MRGFEKRELERQLRKERALAEWEVARERFVSALDEAGVSLTPLVHHVEIQIDDGEMEQVTWWPRDSLDERTSKVREAYSARLLTEIALHGGRTASPGEAHTIRLWMDAAAKGQRMVDAALILTALRATDDRGPDRSSPDVSEFSRMFFDGAYDCLRSGGIDPHTLSSVWFLPTRLPSYSDAVSPDDCVISLARELSHFLKEWVPVVIQFS